MSHNKRKKKDSSDNGQLSSVTDIADKLTVKVEQEKVIDMVAEDNVRLQNLINDLTRLLDEKLKEIEHLKTMLSKSVPLIGGHAEKIVKPDEKEIAELQLQKLKEKAMNGELTLEEARKFEIFSKVKNAENDKKDRVIEPHYARLPKSESELMLIAGTVKKEKIPDEQ